MWIIEKDLICDGEYVGKTSYPFDKKKWDALPEEKKVPFRLFDDDNILYLEGKISNKWLDGDEDHAYDPLNRFMHDLGVTKMHCLEHGKWRSL